MRVISVTSALMLVWLAIPARAADQPAPDLSTLPVVAQSAISATLGRDSLDYYAKPEKGAFKAVNPSQKLVARFSAGGVAFQSANATWKLALSGVGYGEHLGVVNAVAPQANQNRVEYRRGPLTEWYVNGPVGLEQGFTLDQPPGKANGQPLTIALTLSGTLAARVDKSGTGLTLGGRGNLRYSGLTATDADGKQLQAWVDLRGERLLLRVADKGARYPVKVDPWIQQGELTSSDGARGTNFGLSVAISGDTVAVASSAGTPKTKGAVYLFVKPASGWTNMTETSKLETSDETRAHKNSFGVAVAMDGNTVVVGAPGIQGEGMQTPGLAYVFVEPAKGWPPKMVQTGRLTASDGSPGDLFGLSVAISGHTAVVSNTTKNSGTGAAYVFVEPAGGWPKSMTQTAELTASDAKPNDGFGGPVSISGNVAVAGGQHANSEPGAAYVFVKPVGGWKNMVQTAELTSSDGIAGDQLGMAVSISGSTVVAGAPQGATSGGNHTGAAYVFLRSAHGWADMTQTAKLTDSAAPVGEYLGWSVAVSGNTAVAGSPGGSSLGPKGVVCIFVKPKAGWIDMTQTAKLRASDGVLTDSFGSAASINGNTVVVGAPNAAVGSNQDQGKAYVFGR